jgi:hypothetical protein
MNHVPYRFVGLFIKDVGLEIADLFLEGCRPIFGRKLGMLNRKQVLKLGRVVTTQQPQRYFFIVGQGRQQVAAAEGSSLIGRNLCPEID